MKEIEFLKKLDQTAAGALPDVDVSDQVIRDIRVQTREAASARPLWLAAVLSTAVAAAVVLFAVQEISAVQDPFSGLLSPLQTALQ